MNYNDFVDRVAAELPNYPSEMLQHAEIKALQVDKLQDGSYYGISIRPENSNVGISMDVAEAFNRVNNGGSFRGAVNSIAEHAIDALNRSPDITAEQLSDFGQMRTGILPELVPTAGNEALLQTVPHREVEDMSLIYRVMLGSSGDHEMTALVNNSMLRQWGLSNEDFQNTVMEQAPVNFPVSIRSMQSVLHEMLGVNFAPEADDNNGLWVATCNDGFQGAGCICFPGFMDQAAEQMHGDFFILPSSVHEVLILADTPEVNYHELEDMVKGINATEVMPEDRLSDNVFHYDATARVFETAEAHEARKEAEVKRPRDSVLDKLGEKKQQMEALPTEHKHSDRAREPVR